MGILLRVANVRTAVSTRVGTLSGYLLGSLRTPRHGHVHGTPAAAHDRQRGVVAIGHANLRLRRLPLPMNVEIE